MTTDQPKPTELLLGGEILDIFEIMQRFRNDGSCEYVIEAALKLYARTPSPAQAEPHVCASLTDAIEAVKRLRDEWQDSCDNINKRSDDHTAWRASVWAADQIIFKLQSLEGKAPEPFNRTPFDQSLNRILNAVKDDSEVWGIQAVAIKHVFHDAIDAALRTEGKAPVGERCDDCGHDYKATNAEVYDCRVRPYSDDPTICACDNDFHTAATTPSSGEK